MNTRGWKTTAALVLVPLGLAACEGENMFGVPVTGDADDTFEATAIVVEGDGTTIDLVDDGAALEIGLNENAGTFKSLFDDGLGNVVNLNGTFDRVGAQIVFSDDPFTADAAIQPRGFVTEVRDGVLLMTDSNALFDIDRDGDLENVELRITLVER